MQTIELLALYFRISDEDKDLKSNVQKDESDSISAQRNLIYHFIQDKPEFKKYQIREFQDDGYSGTNLERPGLKKMLAMAQDGYVKCIIVKDLSRFGRNYVEIGNYIEQIFPFLGIRFIAVNDHFDSAEHLGQTPELDVAFKNILYDFYSKDLSTKVKSIKRLQQKEGKFVAAKPPYGYLISKENRYKLVSDIATAGYVRLMFEMTLDGKLPSEIAAYLNKRKIPTPVQRNFYQFGFHDRWYNENNIDENYWIGNTVLKILKDPTMYGCTVNNRVQVKSIGSRSFKKQPEKDFIIVPDTHEAIVDQKTFNQVQNIIQGRIANCTGSNRINENLFKGKVYCGECKGRLCHEVSHKPRKTARYYCRHARLTKGERCQQKSIKDESLEQIVFSVIETQLKATIHWDELPEYQSKKTPDISKQIDIWKAEVEKLQSKIPTLYESYCSNHIAREAFLLEKETIRQHITRLQINIKENEDLLIAGEQKPSHSVEYWLKQIKKRENKQSLIDTFVESIFLYSSEHVHIILKGMDVYKNIV